MIITKMFLKPNLKFLFFLLIMLQSSVLYSQEADPALDPDMSYSLNCLEESLYILDTIAKDLWPDWNSYKDETVFIGAPGMPDVFINFDRELPQGFKFMNRKIHNKRIHVRKPGTVKTARSGGSLTLDNKRYRLVRMAVKTKDEDQVHENLLKKVLNTQKLPDYLDKINQSAENYISVIIHETFHRFQIKHQVNPEQIKIPDYNNISMASYLYLESILLHDALASEDLSLKKQLTKMFLAVRFHRRESLDIGEIQFEQLQEWKEGTAFYVDRKALIILDEIKYQPKVLSPTCPNFHGFLLKRDFEKMILVMLKAVGRNIDVPTLKCYYYGMAQCFLLDQLGPEKWKKKLMDEMEYPETLLSKSCGFSENEKSFYLEKAFEKYNFQQLEDEITIKFNK